MRLWFLPLVLLAFVQLALSDTIYMKSGIIYRNVDVIERGDFSVIFNSTEGEKAVDAIDVLAIKDGPYDPSKVSRVDNWDIDSALATKKRQGKKAYEHRPYLVMLPISFILAGLTYDYYDQYHDTGDFVDDLQDTRESLVDIYGKRAKIVGFYDSWIGKLETEKKEKIVLGALCLIGTIVNTAYSFKTVQIRVEGDRLQVNYNF
jgi:hypothetical protein